MLVVVLEGVNISFWISLYFLCLVSLTSSNNTLELVVMNAPAVLKCWKIKKYLLQFKSVSNKRAYRHQHYMPKSKKHLLMVHVWSYIIHLLFHTNIICFTNCSSDLTSQNKNIHYRIDMTALLEYIIGGAELLIISTNYLYNDWRSTVILVLYLKLYTMSPYNSDQVGKELFGMFVEHCSIDRSEYSLPPYHYDISA